MALIKNIQESNQYRVMNNNTSSHKKQSKEQDKTFTFAYSEIELREPFRVNGVKSLINHHVRVNVVRDLN